MSRASKSFKVSSRSLKHSLTSNTLRCRGARTRRSSPTSTPPPAAPHTAPSIPRRARLSVPRRAGSSVPRRGWSLCGIGSRSCTTSAREEQPSLRDRCVSLSLFLPHTHTDSQTHPGSQVAEAVEDELHVLSHSLSLSLSLSLRFSLPLSLSLSFSLSLSLSLYEVRPFSRVDAFRAHQFRESRLLLAAKLTD